MLGKYIWKWGFEQHRKDDDCLLSTTLFIEMKKHSDLVQDTIDLAIDDKFKMHILYEIINTYNFYENIKVIVYNYIILKSTLLENGKLSSHLHSKLWLEHY